MDCQGPVLDRGINPTSGTWRYRAFGLAIVSDVELPHLPAADEAAVDLSIRLGEIEASFLSVPGYRRGRIYDQFRYEAVGGRRIIVEPLAGASPANIADGLMSRVLTIALYQRGVLPLHASAVSLGDRTIAVCGPSGAGKSTLAAMLSALGGTVVADDMLVLADAQEPCGAWRGANGLKLSAASLAAIGMASDGLRLANTAEGKFFLPVPRQSVDAPLTIDTLVCLRRGPPAFARLPALSAAAEWKWCAKMPELVELAPDRNALWRRWLDLVSRSEILLVSHGHDLDVLRAIAGRLADMGVQRKRKGKDHDHIHQRHAGQAQA